MKGRAIIAYRTAAVMVRSGSAVCVPKFEVECTSLGATLAKELKERLSKM